MSPSNFNNIPPENAGDNLELQKADHVTLRHLVAVLGDKLHNVEEDEYGHGTNLYGTSRAYSAASVYLIARGHVASQPDLIATININEYIERRGNWSVTQYYILDTPDGWEINKKISFYPLDISKTGAEETAHQTFTKIAKMPAPDDEAAAYEAAIGVGFVSEKEARELLDTLSSLRPTITRDDL